jgi:signal transduction histidine kinase
VQAEGLLPVSGDAELLRSAFENVIRNAVRYSPVGAWVGITAHRLAGEEHPGGLLEVVIRDQGPGVPEKELGLIFEPFYRVDAARGHGSAAGEGLGLAIAARAVALHGGGIEAHNLEAGGLSVTIRLPAMDSVQTALSSFTPALDAARCKASSSVASGSPARNASSRYEAS